MSEVDHKMLRIGVFYDGGFFHHVSNYYRYSHQRKKRISIPGLHEFIRRQAAEAEGVDVRYSHIVDSHFFRGRFSAQQTQAHEKLYAERAFDDVLMNEGVITHYLPIPGKIEKGIDVWLSLEAFELAIHKRYNVLVLIAGDSDFVPLIRKVSSLGSRVMLLGWDFDYIDNYGKEQKTVTSLRLLKEVTYPVEMHSIIDCKSSRSDRLIDGLFVDDSKPFVRKKPISQDSFGPVEEVDLGEAQEEGEGFSPADREGGEISGNVVNLKGGYGFINCYKYPENVFFHFSQLMNCDFNEIGEGDEVAFTVVSGEKGPVAQNVKLVEG